MATVVEGFRDVQRGFKQAERDVRLGWRKELRAAAEPVRSTAETLAVGEIRSIGLAWSRMRVGVTQTSVYVAPRKRSRNPGRRARPNLAPMLMDRAMQPALDRNQATVERELEQMLERACDKFNRSPF